MSISDMSMSTFCFTGQSAVFTTHVLKSVFDPFTDSVATLNEAGQIPKYERRQARSMAKVGITLVQEVVARTVPPS